MTEQFAAIDEALIPDDIVLAGDNREIANARFTEELPNAQIAHESF